MNSLFTSFLCILEIVSCCSVAADTSRDLVNNPIYESWAKQKVGTMLTLERKAECLEVKKDGANISGITNGGYISYRLKEVTPEHVQLQYVKTLTNERPEIESWPIINVDAKIDPSGLSTLYISWIKPLAEVQNIKNGKETIEISGKKFECETKETTSETIKNGKPLHKIDKIWISRDVPGGIVKYVTTEKDADGSYNTITDVVTNISE